MPFLSADDVCFSLCLVFLGFVNIDVMGLRFSDLSRGFLDVYFAVSHSLLFILSYGILDTATAYKNIIRSITPCLVSGSHTVNQFNFRTHD